MVKNAPAHAGHSDSNPSQEDPLEKAMQPTPVCLPGKPHG